MLDRSSLLNKLGMNNLLYTNQNATQLKTDSPFDTVTVDIPARLEAVIAESHHWAISATIITNCINDMGTKNAADLSQMMLMLVPREAAILAPVRSGMMEIGLNKTQTKGLLDAFPLISVGGNLIAAYAEEAKIMGYTKATVIHRKKLQSHWYMVCEELNEVLSSVMLELSGQVPDIYSKNWAQLRLILIETLNGGTPCIADGTLYYPDLPQRRRSTRVGLLQGCVVHCDGKSYKAFAKDISEGGLGLERCHALPVGKTINVKLAHGRRLFGRVVWANSNMVGVSLSTNLLPSDPLLFG